ncbi:MAG: HAD family hydrolase [Eubacteriaceae bacterium]|nr:HAD family hydrolase [Eubacteriaceae bacterium]MDD4508308.1 HAD family hydrolase [Eubacteriaceae bacterium]
MEKQPQPVQAVIFDIDGTLYDFDTAAEKGMENVVAYAQKQFGVDPPVFKATVQQAWDLVDSRYKKHSPCMHDRLLRFQNTLEILKLPIFPHALRMKEIYWETFYRTIEPEPGIQQVLAALKQKGIKLGIASDMLAEVQWRKLEVLKLGSAFDMIATSEEAGVDKPGWEFLSLCQQKLACPAEACLFIGDNIDRDVRGPAAFGMQAAHYLPYAKQRNLWPHQFDSYEACLNGDEIRFGDIVI